MSGKTVEVDNSSSSGCLAVVAWFGLVWLVFWSDLPEGFLRAVVALETIANSGEAP